jgi:phosphatidate phosphatase APP1
VELNEALNMADWLQKTLFKLEDAYDNMRLSMRSHFGTSRLPVIYPYIGHGNNRTLYLRGRVVLSDKVEEPNEDDTLWVNLKNTYRRFKSSEIPHAVVRATLAGYVQETTCNEEGFFQFELQPEGGISAENFWQQVQLEVLDTPIKGLSTEDSATQAQVIVPPPDAQFAVVSDLDDTIMRTEALNTFKMLRNTFLRNAYTRFAFDGVASFYDNLQKGTTNTHNPIFYVSSSPWNLYDAIMDFFRIKEIPLGPLYLRDLGISRETYRKNGHMGHKLRFIERLLERHPQLPFILIGDSGQQDANIYHEVVRLYPDRILAIYIRDVNVLSRATHVEQVAERVKKEFGIDMLLLKDTSIAAEHAAANGYITQDALKAVKAAVNGQANG